MPFITTEIFSSKTLASHPVPLKLAVKQDNPSSLFGRNALQRVVKLLLVNIRQFEMPEFLLYMLALYLLHLRSENMLNLFTDMKEYSFSNSRANFFSQLL